MRDAWGVNRELSVGETLGEVFSIYREQAGVLLPVAFWLFLVVAIVDGVAGDGPVLLLAALLFSVLVGTLYKGMVVSLVRDVQDGRRESSVGDLLGSVTPVLGPLVGAGVLSALGIGVGLVLLIVPGLILLTLWSVLAPAIVIENRGVLAAFRRSRELVTGYAWPVFGAVLVGYLIVLVGTVVFGNIAASIAGGPLLRIVFGALASTITAPVDALVAAVLYYRLLAIKGRPAVDPVAPIAPPA